MPTSHYKINLKDLKQPDEFITTVDRIGNYITNNLARVIIGAVAIVAVTAVIFAYSFYRSHQDRVAAGHFYEALTALNHKDYKTAQEGFEALAQSDTGKLSSLAPLYVATAYLGDTNRSRLATRSRATSKRRTTPMRRPRPSPAPRRPAHNSASRGRS
jgi:hypothetical protein